MESWLKRALTPVALVGVGWGVEVVHLHIDLPVVRRPLPGGAS